MTDAKTSLSAMSDAGTPVDWWFMYKLPHISKASAAEHGGQPSVGSEYLYFDSTGTHPPALSAHKLGSGGALPATLDALYPLEEKRGGTLGWICYNDERPADFRPHMSDNDTLGHCKGVLAFDTGSDTAFWLLHSTPRYPMLSRAEFPDSLGGIVDKEDEVKYGQTFLCITLPDCGAAAQIAAQMVHQHEPQVYSSNLPAGLDDPHHALHALWQLTQPIVVSDATAPCDVDFRSKGGHPFRLIAKNRHWNDDFWVDLVGPRLEADLDVETWRRDTTDADAVDDDKVHDVKIVRGIDLRPLSQPYVWPNSCDHAKWAVAAVHEAPWVCVGDINLDHSQRKRGGGAICFQHQVLWENLSRIQTVKA
jgi:deoxyribonuclease II